MNSIVPISSSEIVSRLQCIRERKLPIGYDVEGVTFVNCQAFATSPKDGFCIVTEALDAYSQPIWGLVAAILEDPAITKWVWNAHHELAVLKLAHGITLRGWEDGMPIWFEKFPELLKGLKYVSSILTRHPYWAQGIEFSDDESKEEAHEANKRASRGPEFYAYNVADAVYTLELSQHRDMQLTGVSLDRYRMRKNLITCLTDASLRGVDYDQALANRLRDQLESPLWEAQSEVDAIAGISVPPITEQITVGENATVISPLFSAAIAKHCHKVKAKKNPPRTWQEALAIAKKESKPALLTLQQLEYVNDPVRNAKVAALLGVGVNVKSTPQVTNLLNALKLPKVIRTRANDTQSQSKDADALLSVYLRERDECEKKPGRSDQGQRLVIALLKTIRTRTQLQEAARKCDEDGKMRSMLLSCGTTTDRTTSKKWLTGTGGNSQTVPSEPVNFRQCYVPPPNHDWWKLDLTGADAWTVAARCASLGDDTLLLDLQAKLKVPVLIALAMEGRNINEIDRDGLLELSSQYKKDWRYICFKRATYGSFYGMAPKKIRSLVVNDSYDETGIPIDPGLQLCGQTQRILFERYWGVPELWHKWVHNELKRTGGLLAASGLFREFFGRRLRQGQVDEDTLREAYAYEPQAVTTFLINKGVEAAWLDPENMTVPGDVESERVCKQTFLVVHDESCFVAPTDKRDWARAKINGWFTRPFKIGKVELTIPFVLRYGESWGAAKNP